MSSRKYSVLILLIHEVAVPPVGTVLYKSLCRAKRGLRSPSCTYSNQSDVYSIPLIIQSPGSFLCCFLLSTLSSLMMKMLSSLGCLLSSSMPL